MAKKLPERVLQESFVSIFHFQSEYICGKMAECSPILTLLYFSDFETPYDPMIVVMAGKTAGEQQSQPV